MGEIPAVVVPRSVTGGWAVCDQWFGGAPSDHGPVLTALHKSAASESLLAIKPASRAIPNQIRFDPWTFRSKTHSTDYNGFPTMECRYAGHLYANLRW